VFSFNSISITALTVTISKAAAAFGALAGGAGALTNITGNFFKVALAAGDVDTVGDLHYKFVDSILGTVTPDNDGADQVVAVPLTAAQVATAVWQDLTAGSDFATTGSIGLLLATDINATISSRSTYDGSDTSGTTTLLSRIAAAITITGGKVDVNTKTGFSLASTGLDLVLVAGKTLPNALKYIGAATCGVVSGAGSGVESFSDFSGSLAVTVHADSSGNRTSVVFA
jgi:hypothetical protein